MFVLVLSALYPPLTLITDPDWFGSVFVCWICISCICILLALRRAPVSWRCMYSKTDRQTEEPPQQVSLSFSNSIILTLAPNITMQWINYTFSAFLKGILYSSFQRISSCVVQVRHMHLHYMPQRHPAVSPLSVFTKATTHQSIRLSWVGHSH